VLVHEPESRTKLKNTASNVFCTSVATLALQLVEHDRHPKIIERGLAWLTMARNEDCSWGLTTKSNGRVHETFQALRTLSFEQSYQDELARGAKWLLARQNRDGGWGSIEGTTSDPHLTSEVISLLYMIDRERYLKQIADGIRWLKRHQNRNGSWDIISCFDCTGATLYTLLTCNEDIDSEYVQRTVRWLLHKQSSDGSWADYLPSRRGSVISTSMSIRALVLVRRRLGKGIQEKKRNRGSSLTLR